MARLSQVPPETPKDKALDDLVRAGGMLSREIDLSKRMSVILEQSLDVTRSDLASLYLYPDPEKPGEDLKLMLRRGAFEVPGKLKSDMDLIEFISECEEAVVLTGEDHTYFTELLLHKEMISGVALPLKTPKANLGVLILNSRTPNFYNRQKFQFLDSFTDLAGGMLHNSRLFQELKDYLAQIEAMERYQKSIFTSMTNYLVTTDKKGAVQYYNKGAGEYLGLTEKHLGQPAAEVFKDSIDKNILGAVENVRKKKGQVLGAQGIFHTDEKDIDFSLNISPLINEKGGAEGTTLLFTDQSREAELATQMESATEERRVVKDMFARYLSTEVVQALMDSPELVRPGGQTKQSTIFFADIRGYTSFSEGRNPEYIIEVLNAYFSEAVEIVVKTGGYIDKFIGDCIMAVWGVPLEKRGEDAISAVTAAVEIQKIVNSENRAFFKGEAAKLKVGIGMHTGPLIAGNLGSDRRMNYTVIGDTVNIAARLEGVAGPDEIIITEKTLSELSDKFMVEKRKSVPLKGKSEEVKIYAVTGKRTGSQKR